MLEEILDKILPATGGGNSGQNWTMAWNYRTRRSHGP